MAADRRLADAALKLGTAWLLGTALPAQAAWPDWASCPTPPPAAASEVDLHLQVAALIQEEWRARGAAAAVIARSGLNLKTIGHRYSHAGFLTGEGAVRQLYFDCDTAQPRVFDEGLAGFVRGVARDALPRFSVLWWPPEQAPLLALSVADDARATALVSPNYQAQAHVWSLHTQNCNQWLVELMALAFGAGADLQTNPQTLPQPNPGADQEADRMAHRVAAQRWLREHGYTGSVVQLPWVGWLMAAALLPHMGLQHHPAQDLQALRFEVSLPASVERFVQRQWPQAQRVEWCLRGAEVVVRRGWGPLDEHCTPQPGDERRLLAN